jgi:hypothetical protein
LWSSSISPLRFRHDPVDTMMGCLAPEQGRLRFSSTSDRRTGEIEGDPMLKSTIGKWRGCESDKETEAPCSRANENSVDIAKLREILEEFKIGSRIHYTPESTKGEEVESMILGYCINDRHIFSTQEIAEPGSDLILKGEGGIRFSEVSEFLIMLPRADLPTERPDENEIDPRDSSQVAKRISSRMGNRGKKDEKRVRPYTNDFPREAMIELKTVSPSRGVPTMESIVKRSIRLQEGVFVNQTVVFLEPRYQTLHINDRRNFYRVQTDIPIQIKIARGDTHVNCTLSNFSEQHFRIVPISNDPAWMNLKAGQMVVIKVRLQGTDKQFILNTKIARWTEELAVVELKEILHGDKFAPISPLDQLEIKSALLEHPNSR